MSHLQVIVKGIDRRNEEIAEVYGTAVDHAEVSPDSKPSAKMAAQSRNTLNPVSQSAMNTCPPDTLTSFAHPGVS
jgi:hypothetical protein